MAYSRFKIDWKNFFLGFGAMFVALILPVVSNILINIVTTVRDKMPWGNKK